jgi:RHS repeat-associated protein
LLTGLLLAMGLAGVEARGAGDPLPGAVNSQTLRLPDGPGSVRGLADNPQVGVFSAQVAYSVPLQLPEGHAGLKPGLEVVYGGELGNGPVGVGWSLPVASIRRGTRLGVPAYSSADELEVVGLGGGGRLVAVGDGTWRLEGKGNELKVAPDGAGYAITLNGGVRYRLGVTAAGRQAEGTRVAAWYVEEVVHPTGQRIAYSYLQETGQLYLSQVLWGPGDAFRAQLVYEARADKAISYRTGFRVETGKRLDEVRVEAFGQLLRVYQLGYEEGFALSRLKTLRMLGRNAEGALPTLTFHYAPASSSQVQQVDAGGWSLNTNGVSLFDVDGDGMTDLLRLTSTDGHFYRKGTGTGFGPARALPGATGATLATSRLMDVDGDSHPEMVRSFSEAWQVNRLSGETWQAAAKWVGTDALPLFNDFTFVADINGDGRPDVVRKASETISIRYNRPTGLAASITRPAIDGQLLMPGPNVRFHEVNGDGLADVVHLGSGWYRIYLGKGDGTFVSTPLRSFPWSEVTNLADVRLADLNRDGLMDVVHLLNGYVHWYEGRADGSLVPTARRVARPGTDAYAVVVALADVNGNGSEDVVWSSAEGMWLLDMAGPTSAGMMVGVENGMGKSVSVSYEGSAVLAVAAEAAGRPWDKKLATSIPVPVRLEMQPGAGGPARVVEYTVRDGFWDDAERRFGGFLVGGVRTLGGSPADTLYEETRFHAGLGTDRVLRGLPLEVRKLDGLGNLYTVTTTQYETRPVQGLPDTALLRLPARLETRTKHHEGRTTPLETLTTYAYDARVRPIEELHWGRLDLTGDEKVLRRTLASDDTLWVQDVVCEEKVLEADGTLVSHSRTFYGDATSVYGWTDVANCRAGRLVRETQGWLRGDPQGRWVRQTAVEYDAWDNPTRQFEKGIWRTLTYDTHHLRPIAEEVSPETGRTLTWTMGWDNVLGLPLSLTDPNGVTTALGYDSLGRLETLALGTASPHLRYVYDWTGPRPRTLTYTFDGAPEALEGSWTGSWVEGGKWRESVMVANGAGERLYTATRLKPARWILSDWQERDARGKVTYRADAFYWDGTSLPTSLPTQARGQTLAYDALGRLVAQELPTGATKTFSYKSFERTVSMQDMAPLLTSMDGLGRTSRTERSVGGTLERVDATFDAANRIRALRLQNGAVTHGFDYDTLGRMVYAHDADIGPRTLRYDDFDQLTHHTNGANQTRQYFYDGVGRLIRTLGEDGTAFTYHYDLAKDGTATGNTATRLAWVEEPRGEVHLGYDSSGRVVRHTRTIDGFQAEELTTFSPSGLPLTSVVDGLSIETTYDAAGRAVRLGTWWEALDLDATGRVLEEVYGNGIRQKYERNELGLARRIQTLRNGTALYDVTLTRNAYGSPLTVRDGDATGLSHSATFDYDDAARLTDVVLGATVQPDGTLGAGPDSHLFSYRYDGLQNMTSRQASGPKALGLLLGTYRYGERGFGPRQLTSVTHAAGTTELDYDAAGRITRQGQRLMEYNGLDQLVRVSLPGSGGGTATVEHAYGYDGLRTLTRSPGGQTQYWFSPQLTQRGGEREHYVRLAERTLARVTHLTPDSPLAANAGMLSGLFSIHGSVLDGVVAHGFTGLVIGALALVVLAALLSQGTARQRWRRLQAGVLAVALVSLSCDSGVRAAHQSAQRHALWETDQTLYFHAGVAAGPVLLTRQDGTLFEERRYEPFGAPIDAFRELPADGQPVGDIDHHAEPLNSLNRNTDHNTGWSYHGARWMAPETGLWLTPDPPVKAPDPQFLDSPWDLHPYQYVRQNPVLYWDPDGRNPAIEPPTSPRPFMPPPGGGAPMSEPPVARTPLRMPGLQPFQSPITAPPPTTVPPAVQAPAAAGALRTIGGYALTGARILVSIPMVILTVTLWPSSTASNNCQPYMPPAPAGMQASSPEPGSGQTIVSSEYPNVKGGVPYSRYIHLADNGKVVRVRIYNGDGDAVGDVDFKNHKGALSGHGHKYPPGQPDLGHGPGADHIPHDKLPAGWPDLPAGMEPVTPIGT